MDINPVSAKIYSFTPRGRTPLEHRQSIAVAVDPRLEQAPVVEYGCGWYHDAAIADEAAERATAAEAAEKVRPLFPH